MGYLALGVLALTGITLLFGFLLGVKRGLNRSILRTILLAGCVGVAFFLKDKALATLKTISLPIEGGKTFNELIEGLVAGESFLSGVKDQILPVVESLMSLIIYLVVFFALQFLSWLIIFPTLKIFVRKKIFGKKFRLAGGLLGLITGVALCVTVIAPLSGLIGNVSEVLSVVNESKDMLTGVTAEASVSDNDLYSVDGNNVITLYGASGFSAEEPEQANDATNVIDKISETANDIIAKLGIDTYNDSAISKTLNSFGGWYYRKVSTVTTADGKTTNLDVQVGALKGAVKLAANLVEISKLDFGDVENMDMSSLVDKLKDIEAMKGSMSEEEIEALNSMIQNTASTLLNEAGLGEELGIDFESIDIGDINFENEAKMLEDYSNMSQKAPEELTNDDLKTLVNDLAGSNLMLSVVDVATENSEEPIFTLEGDQKTAVEEEIASIEDPEIQAKLNKLFGLTGE